MRSAARRVASEFGHRTLCTTLTIMLFPGALAADPADLCLLAARDAAAINAVPLSVLIAITQTETGRDADGQTRPWPWTINIEGEGHWFDDRAAALAFAEAAYAAGKRSFDIGCFQVNYRWHGENFVSLDQMFDPMANATYAAGFLAQLHAETGDWSAAAGAYHSRTQEYADRYRARFDAFRTAAVSAGADDGTIDLDSAEGEGADIVQVARVNSFPLLQRSGGAPQALGSLVPLLSGG